MSCHDTDPRLIWKRISVIKLEFCPVGIMAKILFQSKIQRLSYHKNCTLEEEFVDAVRHARGSGQPVFSKKEASAISSRRGVLIKSQSTTSVNAITRSKP
ncbi:hypothetical protein VNO77_02196 [Canavalia gladiata]|uniref:Uncharacterized protein n=1 Tax=Canavalia gladiata TaxID=3824 RepID=A0AAN9R706_CANGL